MSENLHTRILRILFRAGTPVATTRKAADELVAEIEDRITSAIRDYADSERAAMFCPDSYWQKFDTAYEQMKHLVDDASDIAKYALSERSDIHQPRHHLRAQGGPVTQPDIHGAIVRSLTDTQRERLRGFDLTNIADAVIRELGLREEWLVDDVEPYDTREQAEERKAELIGDYGDDPPAEGVPVRRRYVTDWTTDERTDHP